MCYRESDPWSWSDIGHALASFIAVCAVAGSAIVFTLAVRDRPSIEAQQIIQAGRVMVEQVGR